MLKQIKQQRQKEIENRENALTRNPLYVVYDVVYSYAEYDTEYSGDTSIVHNDTTDYVRVSVDSEIVEVQEYDDHMGEYKTIVYNEKDEVINTIYHYDEKLDEDEELIDDKYEYYTTFRPALRRFKHDRFETVCFTRKSAEEFIKMERHNLKNPKIYVHACERRNLEMMEMLKLLGDN